MLTCFQNLIKVNLKKTMFLILMFLSKKDVDALPDKDAKLLMIIGGNGKVH